MGVAERGTCIGRLHWQSLRVIGRRDCSTAEEVAQACVEHIRFSTNGGNLRPAITLFAPMRRDGGHIRIWNLALEMGGLRYTAAPFSGWYLTTEIGARNFGDEARYDLLPEVATRMGLDTGSSRNLWKDRALIELCVAVGHSFRLAGMRIVDHHQATGQFVRHVERERAAGRGTPADWSWIVPSVSGSTSEAFHRYYDPPESARRRGLVHHS